MITLLAHHLNTTHTIPTAEKKMALASSLTTTRPLANKISSRLTPIIKSQKTHLSNPTYVFNFPLISTQFKFKSTTTTTMPLVSSRKFYSKVRVSAAGEEAYQEDFNWSSVILPFVFPALGGLLFGYDIGATSSATLSLQSAELSGTTWFNLSAVQLGLVVSGSLYGALFGSILVYPIADFLGRKRELLLAALLYLLGGSVTAYAPGLNVLLLGRVLYGLGIGLAMHGAPLYIAETCPSQIRGTLISLKELFIVLGILLGYFVGSFQIDAVGGWRYMFGFSAPVALLMGLGVWSLPESPRWLLLRAVQGKASLQEYKEKAIVAYSKLRGRPAGDKVSEKQIEDTLVSLKTASGSDQESEGSIFEVFQGPSLKAFVIGGGLVLFQQITGQPSVLYYAGQILQTAGFSAAADATRVSVVIGVFKLLMTSIAILKVDDLGRKPLLIGGISGITISLLLLTAYYKFLGGFPLVAVGALLLYVGCYQISFGPISWLMVSEIFPSRTRGKGVSLAVLTNFGSNALVTFAFSPLKELLGAENLFLLFAAIALLSLGFVLLYVPETKGLSLEEIESKLSKNKTRFCEFLAMPQPDNTQRMTIADASNALRSQNSSGSKASTTQTSPHSQHLQGGSSSWSSDSSPKSKKKSVFTKVKEKAKKLKKSLSKRKHRGDNDLHTSCTTSVVEDDEKEQSEYFGSPLYEPTVAPGTDKRSLEESSLEEMQPHDKGVSVTEYLMHKFEPGEDERALSQVITQTIRCEKMKEAMNSLLGNEEPSDSISKNTNLEPDTAPSSSSWFSQQEGAFHD